MAAHPWQGGAVSGTTSSPDLASGLFIFIGLTRIFLIDPWADPEAFDEYGMPPHRFPPPGTAC